MLRRTGFARKVYEPAPRAPLSRGRMATMGPAELAPAPKDDVVRSVAYRQAVAKLPCKACGLHGHSQAAHPNSPSAGKGGHIKAPDDLCFPLCTVHADVAGNLVQGCHEQFDAGGMFTKEARRTIEPAWTRDTQHQILTLGWWPADLPKPEVS